MSGIYSKITINGVNTSEFLLAYYTSLYNRVPMVMAAGDELLMGIVRETDPHIVTVETMRGRGASVTSMHPEKTRRLLRESAEKAMDRAGTAARSLPDSFDVEIRFRDHMKAFSAANYPGAKQKDAHTVGLVSKDYMDVLRFIKFN
jgi:D-amino peptidase